MSFQRGGTFGIECLEPRAMLSAVTIDRSSDPSADTIDVSTSGSNTLISVNGTNVYTGASASISSLSITGTSYNDTISFDYTNGSPVPNGSIAVDGGGGTNTLAATADTYMTLGSSGLSVGGSEIDTTRVTDVTLTPTSLEAIYILGWLGGATVNLGNTSSFVELSGPAGVTGNSFYAHPLSAALSGSGYSYQTNGYGDVEAVGNGPGSGDVAGIDDYQSPGNATLEPTDSSIVGSGAHFYRIEAFNFAQVTAASFYTSDTAELDDKGGPSSGSRGYMYPTFSQMSIPLSSGTSTITALSYTSDQMNASYNSDVAFLNDSGSSGTLYTHPLSSTFAGPYYSNTANNFGTVDATSYHSSDVADMDDNGATGASNFYSNPADSYWQGSTSKGGYVTHEFGFTTVQSVSYNAGDYAWLTDNVGGAYMSNNGIEMQYGNGTIVGLHNFGGYGNFHISAYNTAPNGQYDIAQSALRPYVVFYGNWTFV